ncbi:MAG: RidA family protein [Afipia sp.]|nr:RidA family protein [Afipia sp.]
MLDMLDPIEKRLNEAGLALPEPWTPRGNFVPLKMAGNLVFMSGQICEWNGEVVCRGPVGQGCTLDEARLAAQTCTLNLLYHLKNVCEGKLSRVSSIIRVGGFVNCLDDFKDSPAVINGASDLLFMLFGEAGRHARTAVGVRGLPGGAAVEVDMIAAVD